MVKKGAVVAVVLLLGAALILWGTRARTDGVIEQTAGGLEESLPTTATNNPGVRPEVIEQAERSPGFDAAPIIAVNHVQVVNALDGELAVGATVTIGAPGMYPPVEATVRPSGLLALPLNPAAEYADASLDVYEILARAPGGASFWGRFETARSPQRTDVLELFGSRALDVRVMDPEGRPISGASARLARDVVGLINLTREHDRERGVISFGDLPAGRYVLTVAASGFLKQTVALEHSLELEEGAAWEVVMERGRAVYGQVVGDDGEPVPNALVTAFMDEYGEPRTLALDDFSRIDSLPARGIAFTDEAGFFAISSLPKGVAYLTAYGDYGIPALSEPLDLRERSPEDGVFLMIEEGRDVEVLVTSADGPVYDADVVWVDAGTGLTVKSKTDKAGIAIFEAVPRGARFSARKGSWASSELVLERADQDGVFRPELFLVEPGSLGALKLRVLLPPRVDVTVKSLAFRSDKGACDGRRVDENDWVFESCAAAPGVLAVETDEFGSYVESFELTEDAEFSVGAPVSVRVVLEGWGARDASEFVFGLTPVEGGGTRRAEVKALNLRGDLFGGELRCYPGRYVAALEVGDDVHSREIVVGDDGATVKFEPKVMSSARVLVADLAGHPVTGASIEVWRGRERLEAVDSRGYEPVLIELERRPGVVLLVCDAARGCASSPMPEARRDEPLVMELAKSPLEGASFVGELTDREVIQRGLGVSLVEDDGRVLLDVLNKESPAAKAGIARGAQLAHVLERAKNEWDVLVRQGGVWRRLTVRPAR